MSPILPKPITQLSLYVFRHGGCKTKKFRYCFYQGRKKLTYTYEFKARRKNAAEIEGFKALDVVYLILLDRFANGNPSIDNVPMKQPYPVDRDDMIFRHDGDLIRIKNQLDYLEDLGITA